MQIIFDAYVMMFPERDDWISLCDVELKKLLDCLNYFFLIGRWSGWQNRITLS